MPDPWAEKMEVGKPETSETRSERLAAEIIEAFDRDFEEDTKRLKRMVKTAHPRGTENPIDDEQYVQAIIDHGEAAHEIRTRFRRLWEEKVKPDQRLGVVNALFRNGKIDILDLLLPDLNSFQRSADSKGSFSGQ